ncbi:MAG: endonuclease MutS2 [Alkalispirochaeta sp.]
MTSFQLLEFDRICREIAGYASCETAANLLSQLTPEGDPESLKQRKELVREVLTRIHDGAPPPREEIPDLEPAFAAVAREGAVLEREDLIGFRRFFSFSEDVLTFCRSGTTPHLAEFVGNHELSPELATRLRRTITPDGEIAEDAIPELARLKGEIARVNRTLLTRAEELIRSGREMYHGEQPTIRDGRTVLPLAANFKGRIDGIIHESSGSGETLFVEPRELVDLNNDLTQAHHAIHREIRRVLRELSSAIRREVPTIRGVYDLVVTIDSIFARALWGRRYDGTIISTGETIDLRNARHPLLGAACVPLSIRLDREVRIVVISGPNTGGKTVLIKTVGLLSLLHQCAVPIPAAPDSTLPVFDRWGVDIGDDQSLDENLSTFSSHMRRIATILGEATQDTLVLLDELGSGTDPDEGAALSMAIIDELIARGSTVLVSTHLTMLKHYGYTRTGARNVSMAFDGTTHRPTYRVVPGRPGASHAIETAADQGVLPKVISSAERYASDRENSVTEIINRLLEQERALQARLDEVILRESALGERLNEIESRETAVNRREGELRREGVRALDEILREARSAIEGEVRRLRERGVTVDRDDIRAAHDQIGRIEAKREEERLRAEELSRQGARDTPETGNGTSPLSGDTSSPLTEGATVRHVRTGKEGTVKSVRGNRVEVQFGALRMTVPRREVIPERGSSAPPGSDGRGRRSGRSRNADISVSAGRTAVFELDIRGKRVHEAIDEVERQVDDAILRGLHSFSVIHGTGTGALQKGVHDYLATRREVVSYRFARPEDGGFGKTMVELSTGNE